MADEFIDRYGAEFSQRGFQLLERLGRGSAGVVLKAFQRSVSRAVAIKIHTALRTADAATEKRFRREAVILGKLDHPNIPYVLTAGELQEAAGKTPYHVMQFVDGEKLSSIIEKRRRLPWREAIALASPILAALAHAAESGIAHRDLAPDNVLIARSGRVFLVDFSLGISTNSVREPGLTRATESGRQLGRSNYSSPEQRRDAASVTDRTDVFSAGVLLYEMLSGTAEVRLADLDQSLAAVPAGIRRAIRIACNADPSRRMTAAEFRAAIDQPVDPVTLGTGAPPATVLCANPLCRGSQRSGRGYVRGPAILEATTNLHCASCGSRLLRRCPGCHGELSAELLRGCMTKKGEAAAKIYCVHCGQLIFEVPECRRCGSLLREPDLGRDTSRLGCAKCPPSPPPEDAPF